MGTVSGANTFARGITQLFQSFTSILPLYLEQSSAGQIKLLPMFIAIAGCAFAVAVVQGESFNCIDIFYLAYQSCGIPLSCLA